MANNVETIRHKLDISDSMWKFYIKEGIVKKQKLNDYEVSVVAREVIVYQRSVIKDYKLKSARDAKELKKINSDPHGIDHETKLIDLALKKENLKRKTFDNKVKRKEYVQIELLGDIVSRMAIEFAGTLDPVTTTLRQLIPDMSTSVFKQLNIKMANARNSLADYATGKIVAEFFRNYKPEDDVSVFDDGE